jgi:hypothetical protein
MSPMRLWIIALAVAAAAACGGGGSSTDNTAAATPGGAGGNTPLGTLRVALTDNPACGYDNVWVTVEKVRVHRDGSAEDGDAAGSTCRCRSSNLCRPLCRPATAAGGLADADQRHAGAAGTGSAPGWHYTQLRLVLAENTASNPYANAIKPTGGAMVPLTTPSAQQSGLKMNVDITVPAGQEVDFAIDFDACKSFVKAGKSGKILLKPVLSVLPIVSQTGQRIQGWLHPSLATAGSDGIGACARRGRARDTADGGQRRQPEVRALSGSGWQLLPSSSPASGYSTAIVTGVPSSATLSTTVNSVAFPILPRCPARKR